MYYGLVMSEHQTMFSLSGKVALVTGASRGLGQALAIGLAEAGADIICASSQKGGVLNTLAKIEALGRRGYSVAADLSDEVSTRAMAQEALEKVGHIDILLNNGGTIARCPAADVSMEEWHRVLNTNLSSAFLLCQLIGSNMIKQGSGKIINIASMLSYTGGSTVPAYTASKHGIAGITKALANEWARYNVQVNAISPGYFRTDNTQALQNDAERNEEIEKRIPAGKWGEPQQLVGAAVFLASAASDYVNGHLLAVDGGWLAR